MNSQNTNRTQKLPYMASYVPWLLLLLTVCITQEMSP